MTAPNRNVFFDVIGTLVSYEHLYEAIKERLGDKLIPRGIQPTLLGICWLEMAEREYAYLSLHGHYVQFLKLFEALFYRCLHYAGVENPRSFAAAEDVAYLMNEFKELKLRDGAAKCIQKLRNAGFTVWCFTTGDISRVGGYFSRAGVDMPAENLLSCDTNGVAKPCPEAYGPILNKLSTSESKPWFAAAHLWDVSGAKSAGFRTAYSMVLEGEYLYEIYGELDVVAETLPAMADKIIARPRTGGIVLKATRRSEGKLFNIQNIAAESADNDFSLLMKFDWRLVILMVVTVGGYTHAGKTPSPGFALPPLTLLVVAPVLEIGKVLAQRGHVVDFETLEGQESWTMGYEYISQLHLMGHGPSHEDLEAYYLRMQE
ncbi:2-haloalkanoic acid dehalogenase [Fusarium globosum]|uniref:2-haloalkanoic acid dehalogenase n=1 Tax=Fusarium globosum TaxID=78864 RepID=A0A8H5XIH7_9HYPO|nr:2-haloalkanoic acid dehalogenase [Fusarium globosum]